MKAATDVSIGDMNGDGDTDIVTASQGSANQLSWWEDESGTGDNWVDIVTFLWDWLGVEGSEDVTRLHPVTPNPCYGPVELRFSLADPGPVTLLVFDLCGRLVASPVEGEVSGGEHSVHLASLPPGAYFVRMTAGENVLRERFVLVGER